MPLILPARPVRPACILALRALLVLALGGLAVTARAQDEAIYRVEGIEVSQEAENALAAQDRAIDVAHEKAYRALVEKLVAPGDQAAMPQLSAAEVTPYVRSFSLSDERRTATRYAATFAFQFEPAAIQELFEGGGVSYTATRGAPRLMVPVWGASDSATLWEPPNPWLETWQLRADRGERRPLVVPLADLSDMASVSAGQALSGDQAALYDLAGRYGAEETVVSQAQLLGNPDAGDATLAIDSTRYGPGGTAEANRVVVTQESGEGLEALLERGREAVALSLAEPWDAQDAVPGGEARHMLVAVPLSGLQDWLAVKRELESVRAVREVRLLSISTRQAELDLLVAGEAPAVESSLAARNLVLSRGAEGWELMRAGAR